MKVELSESEVLGLREQVREATAQLLPRLGIRGIIQALTAYVAMNSDGEFKVYYYNSDYIPDETEREIDVVHLLRRTRPPRKDEVADPLNPHRIKVDDVALIFKPLRGQIEEWVTEKLTEAAKAAEISSKAAESASAA